MRAAATGRATSSSTAAKRCGWDRWTTTGVTASSLRSTVGTGSISGTTSRSPSPARRCMPLPLGCSQRPRLYRPCTTASRTTSSPGSSVMGRRRSGRSILDQGSRRQTRRGLNERAGVRVKKAFVWLPRWWSCDLAKLSMVLDDRWQVGYWAEAGIAPGRPCEACSRRASIHVLGGRDDDSPEDPHSVVGDRPVYVCGWCQVRGQIDSAARLVAALAEAREDSISRWRWRVRREVPVP